MSATARENARDANTDNLIAIRNTLRSAANDQAMSNEAFFALVCVVVDAYAPTR